jgi:uncharacterized protein
MTNDGMSDDRSKVAACHGSRWLRVLTFYVIAVACAAASRFLWHTNDVTSKWPSLGAMHWHLISGIGPSIGAIVVWATFHPRRIKSFGGTNPPIAWAMLAVPAVAMGLMGIPNPYALDVHWFGFYCGIWIVVYAVLEETGWRGYLQDEFRDLTPLRRYLVVALFWYPWHFTFLQHHSFANEVAIIGFIALASIGIGFVADRTNSIVAAACFHSTANILGLTAYFTVFVPSTTARLMIVGICVAVWVVMLRIWRTRTLPRDQQPAGSD